MEINSETVRHERQQRGWTQQHLAEAAGCSLRTVQRIEKQGLASNESVSALCAVFDIERDRLLAGSGGSAAGGDARRVGLLIAAAAAAGAGLGSAMTWLAMSLGGAA
ncbi:transcriptional regulator [Tamilnaduibacter salinus]|uniref:Transcriptional regulator n=1 Tax=Tamilnaduibacter salinus TaxID=1484056 RepID=A0A2A2I4C9_9GAMM|nr:helix-turn-helix transcriptional regulator [Tamilnaduibacter salinus]PAV26134.1 transcriptional regulator [Tamilnaduibacter salinus]